jgi:hypothetical protein
VTTTKKRKLSPVALSAVIGGVMVLVLAAGVFLVVLPQKNKAADIGTEIVATNDQIVQARALAMQKPAQPIRVASLFKLVKAMPDGADMTGILLQLNQTATDAGIEFDTITPGDPSPGTGYQKLGIGLTFMGNYYGLTDFLFRLRSLVTVRGGALAATGRLFSVDGIDFAAGVGGFPMISATIKVSAYIYGGGVPVTPVPGAPTTPTDTTSTAPASTTPTTPAPTASGVTN